ncbi:MAG: alpha/beta fold hydrolase [Sandaracinaceae bacterium]|nr:alpha/beta fold hydrolase [Sandaracinaceae bacterium]
MIEAIVREFEAQLAELAARHAGRPEAELDALWVIGVEREAIVTVAYRGSVIEARLAKMPLDDATRAAVARAIRWAWRDETVHTLWVRGALLRREPLLRARALAAQVEGVVGGWVSSRQNHLEWTEAPVSRLVAEALELAGVASGRVPEAVRGALHWNTFSDFCRFNVAAETTASMAWRRMTELARSIEGHEADAAGFAHMAEDELRHARIFTILADAFDAEDRAIVELDALTASLAAVGQRFVARPDAAGTAWRNPLGKGGRVIVREDDDPAAAVQAALDATGLADELARHEAPVVAVKTTFMLVTDARDPSPAVSVPVTRAVLAWLEARGATARLIDARNHYDAFHANRSVREVAAYLGLGDVDVVDAQEDAAPHAYARGMDLSTMSATWRDADVRVLLGKLRGHPTSNALLSLEAAEGLGDRIDEHLFAQRRTERETIALMGLDAFPPHVALLDATDHVPDGLMGVLGGGAATLRPRRVYASTDAVALDAVACRHIGADPTDEVMLVSHAFDWFGDPRDATEVDGPDTPIDGFRLPSASLRTAALATVADPVYRYASARGALFLPPFDEAAFPPLAPATGVMRAARSITRALVDDGAVLGGGLLSTRTVAGLRVARLGEGPPVVLLHGYPETLQVWSNVAPALAQRGREVIAIDWPGLGGSAEVDGPADPEALAGHLERALDALGIARADLVGADMGAPPALVLAARRPERVRSVTALSALLFGDEATSPEIRIMRRAGLAGAAFSLAPGVVYAQCKRTFLGPGEQLSPALDRDFRTAFFRPAVRARLAKMCEDYEAALPGLPSIYWHIERPVRLLWAERSGHFPPAHGERLCALLAQARMDVLPGARHWMALSRADEVAEHLAGYLEEAGP